MPITTQETKSFYLTSEFWLHAVGQLLLWVGALPTSGAPGWVKTVVSLALVASYGLSRGVAKSGSPREATVGGDPANVVLTETQTVGSGKAEGFVPPTAKQEAEALGPGAAS